MLVTRQSVQFNNESLDFLSLLSWIRVSGHVVNEESSHVESLFVHHDSQGCSTQLCTETCCGEKCLTSWKNQTCFWVFQKSVMMTRFDAER